MSLLISIIAVLAAAVPQFGSEFQDAGMNDLQRRQLVYKFGRCVVKDQAKLARRVLTENLTAGEISRKHSKLFDGDCLFAAWPVTIADAVQMTLPGDLARYSFADALVEQEFPSGLPGDLGTRPPLAHAPVDMARFEPKPGKKLKPAQLEAMARDKALALRDLALNQFGECVVRASPTGAHRLILQQPGSPGERAAFVALQSALNSCLDAGQTFSANLTVLRGTVALNAFRLATASSAITVTR